MRHRAQSLAAILLALGVSSDVLACPSLFECRTEFLSEPSTELGRTAHSSIELLTPIDEARRLLGRPTAVTLQGDKDPNGDFQLLGPEVPGPQELATLWYANGKCGPIALLSQVHEGQLETLVVGAARLCVMEPDKTFPFHPPHEQRCDGGRKKHRYCQ